MLNLTDFKRIIFLLEDKGILILRCPPRSSLKLDHLIRDEVLMAGITFMENRELLLLLIQLLLLLQIVLLSLFQIFSLSDILHLIILR